MSEECIHYWCIDSEDKGTCKKCGAIRDFRPLLARERNKGNKIEWFYIPTESSLGVREKELQAVGFAGARYLTIPDSL